MNSHKHDSHTRKGNGNVHAGGNGRKKESEGLKAFIKKLGVDLVGIADLSGLGLLTLGLPIDGDILFRRYRNAVVLAVPFGKLGPGVSGDDVSKLLESVMLDVMAYMEERGFYYLPIHTEDEFDPVKRLGLVSLKVLAKVAGLGWQGRSLLIVSPEHGPLHRLAAILTNMDLEPDMPVDTCHCGDCAACVDKCPPKALKWSRFNDHPGTREEVLDIAKCRGDAGCTVCIAVCPWLQKDSADKKIQPKEPPQAKDAEPRNGNLSKKEQYRAMLQKVDDWDPFLLENSGLPGKRANIELMQAVVENGDEELFVKYLNYTANIAPTDSKEEFLAFCGVVGLGKLILEGHLKYFNMLKSFASDKRWRVREAVAFALQRVGRRDFDFLVREIKPWANGSLLEQRAVAATLCEPELLTIAERAKEVLELLFRITAFIVILENERKTEAFRVLRKALGYCWSVAVAACPQEGKPVFQRLFSVKDKDILRIIKENLKKKRLLRMDETWVRGMCRKLEDSP